MDNPYKHDHNPLNADFHGGICPACEWERDERGAPDPTENAARPTEAAVKFVAGGLLTSAAVDRWYDTPNRHLNNATPRQFVDAGDGVRVMELLIHMSDPGFL